MKKQKNDEFIVAAVAGFTGVFVLAMSWSEFQSVAKEHPGVRVFAVGLMLVFIAFGMLSAGLKKRIWIRTLENMGAQHPSGPYSKS